MILFLYGEDTYRSKQKLNEIIKHYKKIHKSGLNLLVFEAKETNFQDFSDKIRITSMFKEKRLIILKDLFSNLKFQEAFLKNIKKLVKSKDVIVIFEEGVVDKKSKIFESLKKEAKSQEFKPLDAQKLKRWTEKEFKKYKVKIESKALNLLTDFVGNDLWRLNNEIQKLVNYQKKGKIEIKDIELLVRPKIETDIFKTIDAISEKNTKQALKLLHRHLEKGDSPLYLLSMINFQFRNILMVKDLIERRFPYKAILKKTNLPSFVVRKSYFQSQKFTLEELKKIYQNIFETDLSIKTGKMEAKIALDLLIANISSLSPAPFAQAKY